MLSLKKAFLLLLLLPLIAASQKTAPEKGPPIGQPMPNFQARDQFGHDQSPKTLTGRDGLVLLFFRSADW